MAKYDALHEVNIKEIEDLSDYFSYCKYYFKPKTKEKINFYESFNELKKDFPFIKQDIRNNDKYKKYKMNNTFKEFPLNWIKNEILGTTRVLDFSNDVQLNRAKEITGILDLHNTKSIDKIMKALPHYSFIIWTKFKLISLYFSKDDDDFYIIQNPVLKEKVFKIPMVRGSGWKGALASAFKNLLNEDKSIHIRKSLIESFLRIFGAGSESIKTIESYLKEETNNLEKLKDKFLEFVLFELGIEVNQELINRVKEATDETTVLNLLKETLSQKIIRDKKVAKLPIEFLTHKGRAIFYPTYFDRLTLEVINPHDRRKRAGTQPIYYEVVPPGTEGILQIVYIPFDGILKKEEDLKEEVRKDLESLIQSLEKLSELGIGAKTKLGWGRFKFNRKIYCTNDLKAEKLPEGWEGCQD